MQERWWHRAVGYQVYPRSFQDANGDGIGDIPGLISRLDHLRDLGIGFIWLSPVYASPMADNGYDISDYRAIAPEFGTLEDFDRLVAEAAARGIRIVMDLVVNHSSSEHRWFRAARASANAPEHDFYIWRDPAPDGGPPDARKAVFGGPAWSLVPEIGKYYLHFFSPGQPDLNWANPALRHEIYDMMRWWFDRGIGGFRMDVIDLIGKDVDAGAYELGPHLHDYLQEMHREALAGRDILTVGESWNATLENALDFCGRDRRELDMVFQFAHIMAGWDSDLGKFAPKRVDLATLKRVLFDWQALLADDGWNALFLSNHDLPRQVSKYGDDGAFRVASARALATVLHLMKGTPFIYQGEEIGMTNVPFMRLDQFRDLETLNHWQELKARGVDWDSFLKGANAEGRDNARTPMQWDAGAGAGFTAGMPWIEVNPNHRSINVEADHADPEGVFRHYARLTRLRRDEDVVSHGRFAGFAVEDPQIVAYSRELDGARLSVVANLSGAPAKFDVPDALKANGECVSYSRAPLGELSGRLTLRPWDAWAVLDRGAS